MLRRHSRDGAMTAADGTKLLFDGKLFADYFQIYLRCAATMALPEIWDDAIVAQRVSRGPGSLVISTARNMTVPLRVLLHASRPALDPAGFDHLVEASLEVPSGQLVIAGLTEEPADDHAVPPGRLGALVGFQGLGTLSPDGLDGHDRYAVHLWPGAAVGGQVVTVHRQWREDLPA
jgi:hypothetical protein